MGYLNANALVRWLLLSSFSILSNAGTVHLPSYPLAVKSPYFSTWGPGNQILSSAATTQPEFWAGQFINWPVLARVNGKLYSLFSVPSGTANVTPAKTVSVSYTSSHTLIHLSADSVSFALDFFSPVLVQPTDYAHQSLPYSYLTINASTSTGKSTSIQILGGIDQTWTGQNGSSHLTYNASSAFGYFTFYNPGNVLFSESSDMATYGSIIFSAPTSHTLSQGCDTNANIYGKFGSTGALSASAPSEKCGNNDLAALVQNMGDISKAGGSVTFAVGFDRDNVINYLGTAQTGYYRTQWQTVSEALAVVFSNYKNVYTRSLAFDAEVRTRSENVSSSFGNQYADLVEASVRQSFAAIELTVSGNLNFSRNSI